MHMAKTVGIKKRLGTRMLLRTGRRCINVQGAKGAKLPIAVRKQNTITTIQGQAVRIQSGEMARSITASGPM
jgi:hypothetical protein